jgi:predicted type IV restriction endonuclease
VPPAELQAPIPTEDSPSHQPVAERSKTDSSDVVTTEAEAEVYDYVKRRLPFLIDRDEDLYRRLDDVNYRDYKGTFTISYKQDRKGRLLNFREGADGSYRFEFPESGEILVNNDLSEIDDALLAIFMRRVEELG